MPQSIKIILAVGVIAAGIYIRHSFYKRSYGECPPGEKRFRRVAAWIGAIAGVLGVATAIARNCGPH